MFKIKRKKIDSVLVVAAKGDLIYGECDELACFLAKMFLEGKYCIIVDFSGIEFISTKGVRAIIAGAEKTRVFGGDIKIIRLSGELQIFFKAAGAWGLLDICETEGGAISRFGRGVGYVERHLLWKMQ